MKPKLSQEEIQAIVDDISKQKFSNLTDNQLDAYERSRYLIRNEQWRKKIGLKHKGKIVSDETKKLISHQSKKLKHTEETKRKCREASLGVNVGKKRTEEEKKKISEKAKGRKASEETKKKMSEKRKHKKPSLNTIESAIESNSKPVLCYTLPNTVFYKEYPSVKDAVNDLKINKMTIIKSCKGRIKKPRKYIFKYK